MAFVVEDGTGLSDANSYTDVAFADGYFLDRGISAWAGTNTEKQAWLIRATDYIEGRFGDLFLGEKKTDTQALAWPRVNAADFTDTTIPTALKKATAEYALRAISDSLAPDPKYDSSGVVTVATQKKVGPLETSYSVVSNGAGSTVSAFRPYPAADMLLKGLLRQTQGRVIR